MDQQELIPHLFRTEYRKIVSVLCKRFGIGRIEMAEDIASETFLTAAQTWAIHGAPPNPVAWLYTVARNKAFNTLHRDALFAESIAPGLPIGEPEHSGDDIDLSSENISDSQLQMMFAICHPSIPPEAQIGLSLRILCGFGIDEIADAFLANKETINKRLFRAREKLREEKIAIAMPGPADIADRLPTVLTTLYLLFSEGYYSVSQDRTLRKELCLEAMRLCTMLADNPRTNTPEVNALLALMCFHASRFDARVNGSGELILYEEQDPNLWNADLISRGGEYLHRASEGRVVSKYHLEAAIAYWHTRRADSAEKWESILRLYDQLLATAYSPMAALNRIYALSKVGGKRSAIEDAERLEMTDNHLYLLLLGELYTGIDNAKAREHLRRALELAKTESDRKVIQRKFDGL